MLWLTSLIVSTLSVDVVLDNVRRFHPDIRASEARVDQAQGAALAAEGAFDVQLYGTGFFDPSGYYERTRGEVELRKLTPLWGLELSAGYANGADWPVYDAKNITGRYGQWFARAVLPLWRDRSIDEFRLRRTLAQIELDLSKAALQQQQIATLSAAGRAYWHWAAAGQRWLLAKERRTLAESRQAGIESQVERGDAAAILAVDNKRLVLVRREQEVASEQALQERALALSLFLRHPDGTMRIPEPRELPESIAPPERPNDPSIDKHLRVASAMRPELAVLADRQRAVAKTLEWATNQRAPRIDAGISVTSDVGHAEVIQRSPVRPPETSALLHLSLAWPIEQSRARGQSAAALAEQRLLDVLWRFLGEQIEVEVRQIFVAIDAAHRRFILADEAVVLSETVERAERRKLQLGQSSVLLINAREDYTLEAVSRRIEAAAECHIADIAMRAATGMLR